MQLLYPREIFFDMALVIAPEEIKKYRCYAVKPNGFYIHERDKRPSPILFEVDVEANEFKINPSSAWTATDCERAISIIVEKLKCIRSFDKKIRESFISILRKLKEKRKPAVRLFIDCKAIDLKTEEGCGVVENLRVITTEDNLSLEGRTPLGTIRITDITLQLKGFDGSGDETAFVAILGGDFFQSLQFVSEFLTLLDTNLDDYLVKFEEKGLGAWAQ